MTVASHVPAVVVGAGPAGVTVSRHLAERGVEHVVLERGRIGETWLSQRWDSFRVNTPNSRNGLGGVFPADPTAFPTAPDLVAYLGRVVDEKALPVREGVTVTAVERTGDGFRVRTTDAASPELYAGAVVVASGGQNVARRPVSAAGIPPAVLQIHAGEYRNAAALPPGAVLVVGGAQSGCQIAEDLLAAGREVYLSVSRVSRARRRYRGEDIILWFDASGYLDQRPSDLPDPAMIRNAQPQISGVGLNGHTVSLQGMAQRGVKLVGRLTAADADALHFDDSVADCIRFADEGSQRIKGMVDDYLTASGQTLPAVEIDLEDEACADPTALSGPAQLPMGTFGTVVWSTGFGGDFSWLPREAVDPTGSPLHVDGVSPLPGLFFVGLPWLRFRRSGILSGMDGDGAWIAAGVANHLGR